MATIYCFSSTGNSLHAAKAIAGRIGGKVLPMDTNSLACDDSVVGFVFPIYFWGMPRLVERFAGQLQLTGDAYVFAVATYGNVVNGTLGWFRKILRSNGITLNYSQYIKSVENYIPSFKVNNTEEVHSQADGKIARIADDIAQKKRNVPQPPTIINRIAYSFYPNEESDMFFTVAQSCNGCAICQAICPAKNITISQGKPEFHQKCEHCLACLHSCPHQALDWKNKTQGKERYKNPFIKQKELIALSSGETGSSEG